MRKYEFTGEEKEIFYSGKTVTLHRIRAVRSFGEVKTAWTIKTGRKNGDIYICLGDSIRCRSSFAMFSENEQ